MKDCLEQQCNDYLNSDMFCIMFYLYKTDSIFYIMSEIDFV